MHDITSTPPVGVNFPLGFNAKWPPHVNRRRAPGVLRLGFNGYGLGAQKRDVDRDAVSTFYKYYLNSVGGSYTHI